MDVPVVEDAIVDGQGLGMGLDILEGENGTLLHDVAQIAGERELRALALRQGGLDEQDLAADAGPCQSGDDAGIVVALIDVAIEGRLAQQVLERVGGDLGVDLSLEVGLHGHVVGQLAHGLVDLLLELAHTALTGVLLDDLLDGGLVELGLVLEGLQSGIAMRSSSGRGMVLRLLAVAMNNTFDRS